MRSDCADADADEDRGGGGRGPHGQVFVRGVVEAGVSRSQGKHEGESSNALCDRCSRTRDASQRQLPTDQDYAVSTRECQTDQSSHNLSWLLLALFSTNGKSDDNNKSNPTDMRELTGSLLIRLFFYFSCEEGIVVSHPSRKNCKKQVLRLTALAQDDNGEGGASRLYTNDENTLTVTAPTARSDWL